MCFFRAEMRETISKIMIFARMKSRTVPRSWGSKISQQIEYPGLDFEGPGGQK